MKKIQNILFVPLMASLFFVESLPAQAKPGVVKEPTACKTQYVTQVTQATNGTSLPKMDRAVVLPADDSRVPHSLRQLYRQDAERLALRLIQAAQPESEVVELPTELVQTLYNALIHVYNATNLPARDAVVETYEIHSFGRPVTRSLIVGVDPKTAWVAALRNSKRLSGNPQVDALMKKFGLRLSDYFEFSLGYVVLEADRSLNIAALAKRFVGLTGVYSAEPNSLSGDGNDINAQSVNNYWQLDYSRGYGDCPAGCTGRHIWTFRVGKNGLVKYVGSWGTLPPAP